MSITTRLRWKRVVNELRFLHEELSLLKEIATKTNTAFQEHYERFCAERGIDIRALNDKHRERIDELYGVKKEVAPEEEPPPVDGPPPGPGELVVGSLAEPASEEPPEIEDVDIHDSFAKLFKTIATKIHPDKAQNEEARRDYEAKFKEAKEALDFQKYFKLIELAEELDIDLPKNYNEQIRWMKKENKRMSKIIGKQRTTYNYLFAEAENETARDELIKGFLKQLFGLTVE